MKKYTNKYLIALSALSVACLAVGAAKLKPVSADTTVNTAANTVTTVDFRMEAGAAVRIDTTGNGIRYHVTMPAAEYTALEANTTYSSVIYGILVAPADYEKTYGELNKANVFGIGDDGSAVEAKYDYSVKNDEGDLEYNDDSSKVRIMNFRTGKLTEYTAENGDLMAGYYGSIIDLHTDNIVRDFIGVGYIRYTDAQTGKTDYVFAERNDNVRSMADVARSAIADEDVSTDDKATLKTTYLENVYKNYWQFDTAGSKQIVSGAALSWDSVGTDDYAVSALIKNDSFDADGVGNDDYATTGRQDLIIDMGGLYKVKEIQSITVRYRYLNDAPIGGSYVNIHLNVNGDKEQNNRLTGLTYAGANGSWYLAKASTEFETLTILQTSLKSNVLNGTLLTDEDYLTSLNFSQPAWRDSDIAMQCRVRMQIDSVEVKLVPQFKAEYLEFNSDAAMDIVSGMGVQMVDLGNGNKAVQATFKNDYLNDSNTTMDDGAATKVDFRVNLGGMYKVSEIESIEFSYRIVNDVSNSLWWRLFLNDITDDARRITGAGIPAASKMETFSTVTLTNALLKNNTIGGAILSDDDYVSSFTFANVSYQTSLDFRCTMQIDYIRINLKSAS